MDSSEQLRVLELANARRDGLLMQRFGAHPLNTKVQRDTDDDPPPDAG